MFQLDRGQPPPEEKRVAQSSAARRDADRNVFEVVVEEQIARTANPTKTTRPDLLLIQGKPDAAVETLDLAGKVRLLAARLKPADALKVEPPDADKLK